MKKTLLSMALIIVSMLPTLGNADALFTPGTYEGTARGFHGPITVQVEVSDSEILNVAVTEEEETYHIGQLAFPILEESIVSNQSLADVITGATITSRATTHAVTNALQAAGASTETIAALKQASLNIENPGDTEADVVVVGAGAAGMMAAMKAYDGGAKVILLEKNSIAGGSARLSAGGILAVGAKEFEDTPFTIEDIRMWYSIQAGPINNLDVFYKVIGSTKDALEYFQENGYVVPFIGQNMAKYAPFLYACGAEHWGVSVADKAVEAVEARDIDLRYNSTVTDLVWDANGTICGVTVENREGTYTITAKKVILATGGFSYNREMMAQYSEGWDDAFCITASGATGDGHRMGVEAGGHLIGEGALPNYCGSYNPLQPFPIPIYVDSNGLQCAAMDEHYTTLATKFKEIENGPAWGIYSSDNLYSIFDFEHGGVYTDNGILDQMVENGQMYKADTLEELAEMISVSPEALIKTVNEHNWYYDHQIADYWGTKTEYMYPIKNGPFYACREVACVMGTITGLEINTNMEVVDSDGNAIPNLYAVGELIFGNIFNHTYPLSGTAIGTALTSGMLAGQNAAASVQ